MKTDNSTYTGTSGKNRFLSLMVRNNDNSKSPILIAILPLLSMLAAIWPGVFHDSAGTDIAKIGIITLVLTASITFYIRLNADSTLNKSLAKTIIVIGYLGSICLLLLVPNPELYSLWMIGGLIISMLIDNKLGLLCNFNLTFIMGIMLNLHPEIVIQILIICVLLSILAGALRNKSTAVYATIIILSINVTLAFAVNNFAFERTRNFDYVRSLFGILAVLIVSYLVTYLYQKMIKSEDSNLTTPEFLNESEVLSQKLLTATTIQAFQELAITEDTTQTEAPSNETNTSFEVLCDYENELIQKLKLYSEELYLHAIFIGELSARAAKLIQADEYLAKAGGLYHEIGKINGKNYIEEGLKLAEDYSFPKELKAIIKEHNIKYDKPNSLEAAIVMLSDNVASTIDYIEKTGDNRYTTDKIIDNIFQMRFDKGTFDTCGVSLKDFKVLKEFYQEEFKNRA